MGWEREPEVGWKRTRKRRRSPWRLVLPLMGLLVVSVLAILTVGVIWAKQIGAALLASLAQGLAAMAALLSVMTTVALLMVALMILETPPLLLPFHPLARMLWLAASTLLQGNLSP